MEYELINGFCVVGIVTMLFGLGVLVAHICKSLCGYCNYQELEKKYNDTFEELTKLKQENEILKKMLSESSRAVCVSKKHYNKLKGLRGYNEHLF